MPSVTAHLVSNADTLACFHPNGSKHFALQESTEPFMPVVKHRGHQAAAFLVEASPQHLSSFHGHAAAPQTPAEALAQAKAGLKTCALGFMASSAALLSAYVTWSLEKEHFEHEVHEHHQRHGHATRH
mmetsp:Transcript_53406/g.124338  ORF Transcript_53406/g.124338 Transcript_53406/m.124338 type:complete len:128 (-) Transcript_53406:152-535(-)